MPNRKSKKRRKPKRPLRRSTRRSKAPRRKPKLPPRPCPGPRKKLSDAMREQGLDETKVAAKFKRLLSRVDNKGHEKLMLDTLKECSKHLEPDPAARAGADSDAPVPIQLVHFVPRPEREETPAEEPPGSEDTTAGPV